MNFFDDDKSFFGVHHPCHYFLGMKNARTSKFYPGCRLKLIQNLDLLFLMNDDTSHIGKGCLWGGKVPDVFKLIDEMKTRIDDDKR